jgi:hypothetical protein
VAEFERSLMLERQRVGIARAKAEGKYRGRQPTARAKTKEVLALKRQGIGATAIAKRIKISRASVYRVLTATAAGAGDGRQERTPGTAWCMDQVRGRNNPTPSGVRRCGRSSGGPAPACG